MLRNFLVATCVLAAPTLLTASPGFSRSEVHEPVEEVRFVILGDTQFANMGVFEQMAYEIEMLRPNFVIQVGDLINGYTHDRETARAEWVTFRNQIKPIALPFYPVAGNHDVVTPETQEVYAEEWGEDRFTYSFTWGNAHCIVLNSFWSDENGKQHDRVEQWQRDWLASDLKEFSELHEGDLADQSIFVFVHSPLWRYAADHPGRKDWDLVHDILKEYPIKLVSGGHTHEHVWEQRDGINYLILNSSGGKGQDNERGGFFHAYLHVSVVGDDVRYATIKANSILPLDTVDSNDRRQYPRYAIRSEMLNVDEWIVGSTLNSEISLPLRNPLDQPRRYRLDWRVPLGADITAEPQGMWVELAPGESRDLSFRLTSPSAPELNKRPVLEVSATDTIRTGVVDRESEAQIREDWKAADEDPSRFRTQIPLDKPTTFTARHTLFIPPVANAAQLSGTIQLDGKLDEAAWEAATPVDDFINASAEEGTATSVRFLYDEEYLYVGAWLGEPNPEGLVANADRSTPMAFVWDDDDFELFFDAAITRSEYSRLFTNSAGTRFNSRPRNWEEGIRYFPSEYKAAIHIGDDHWSVEMQIPWSDMNVPANPESGTRWGIMIARNRQQQSRALMQWRGPTGTGGYDPRQYGILRFE